ncbi:ABC transporter ATP-binding protein [Glaciimonas soli]|uniref:ATP-binding cassette domain-containing protein n=1 Tax=Glaciimonas soli TaxID=2590999 RepID=A0A843YR92_9BURK|nr:ATP-binding cassette domain-containing protein [Glaciimonas soli]
MMNAVLTLHQVSKQFGKAAIIRDASLRVQAGERLALIGPNGAGKSTLFNLISGRSAPSSGQIMLNGKNIAGLAPFKIHRLGLSRSFQVTNIFPQLSVQENLRAAVLWSCGCKYTFWKRLRGLSEVNAKVDILLAQINLLHQRETFAHALTYAEQRALEIGITIAADTQLILLDEPTAGMSRQESELAVALIKNVTINKTLLMIEHDMNVVFDLADRIAVLVSGQIIACDTPEKIRANPLVQAAYLGDETRREDNKEIFG